MPPSPIELTDEQVMQVEALAAYLTQEQIADYLGIAERTFRGILGRDHRVLAAYKKGKAKAIGKVAHGLLQQAISGDKTASIFYLKTQAGWRETQHVDHTSSDGTMSTKPVDLTMISTDALEELMDAYGPEEDTPIN